MRCRERILSCRDEMISAYKRGCSLDFLAERYAVSPSTVRRYLLSWGVLLRPPVRTGPLFGKETEAETMYRSGMNTRQIAQCLHADRNTVSAILKARKVLRKAPLAERQFFIEREGDRGVLAGLIAGEGSIVFRRNGVGSVLVSVTNTDPDIIDWLDRWGGRTYWDEPRQNTRIRGIKPVGTWRLSRVVDVFHCLSAILPWMFGKKRLLARQGIELLKSRYGLREIRALAGLPANHSKESSSLSHRSAS